MSEEIKIRITNEVDTRPLTDEEKKIQDLTRAAKAYEAKGMTPAAKSARSEAAELQKALITKRQLEETTMRAAGKTALADAAASEVAEMQMSLDLQKKLGVTYGEGLSIARSQIASEAQIAEETAARLALEKAVTREKTEQLTLESLLNGKVRNELISAARLAATGGNAGRSLSSAAGNVVSGLSKMGPAGMMVAAAIGAAAVFAIYKANQDEEKEKDQAQQNKIGEEKAADRRENRKLESWRGSAGEAAEDAFKDEQDYQKRLWHEKELERAAQTKWYKPATWDFFGLRKTQGQRDIEENKAEEQRDKEDEAEKRKIEDQKYQDEGSLKLDIARDTAMHSAAGIKKRRTDKATLSWMEQYKSALQDFGEDHEKEAAEFATLNVKEEMRQQQIRNASSLVNARSGAGDIAQAARLANGMADWGATLKSIDAKHTELLAHARAASDAVTRFDHGSAKRPQNAFH